MKETELMSKVFSEQTPDAFKDSINDCIQEALLNGQSTYSEYGEQLYFAAVDGSVVIEDKKNGNEVTVAAPAGDGSTTLTVGQPTASATQPNAIVPRVKGKDGQHIETHEDVNSPITVGITNTEKAGVGKNFSLTFDGFESEDEVREFSDSLDELVEENEMYSDALEELTENSLTFSDEEVENLAYSATELQHGVERLAGTQDINLAFSLLEDIDQVRSYAVLAQGQGHDVSDVIEACNAYSEYINDSFDEIIANTPVNDYFSELDEDELNEYFSNLDEVEAQVLYSALTDDDENYTFSDVQEAINETYSDLVMESPVNDVFSEMDEDEINDLFSDLTESEMNVVFSVLDEDEDASFSDINEALEVANTPLNEMFSDMSEDELNEYFSDFTDDEVEVFSDMVEDGNYTFSEFSDVIEEMRDFSDEDCEVLASNANAIFSAYEDLIKSPSLDLAEQVAYYSEKTLEDCARAENCGHDVVDVTNMANTTLEGASKIADKIDSVEPAKEVNKEPIFKETKVNCGTAEYSDTEDNSLMRVFSDGVATETSVNPCLTSPIN